MNIPARPNAARKAVAMDRIAELVALGYDTLTADQLTELQGLLTARQAELVADGATPTLADLTSARDVAVALRAETDRRTAEASDTATALAELNEALTPPVAEPVAEPAVDVTPAAVEVATPAAAPVPVAAAAPRPAPLAAVAAAAQAQAPVTPVANPAVVATITASAGPAAGQTLDGRSRDQVTEDLAAGFQQAFSDIRRGGLARIPVIASRWNLPGRQLTEDNGWETNSEIMREQIASQIAPITASIGGGVCRPVEIDYSVPTWSNREMPMHAALPRIPATRGGLQFGLPVPYDATTYEAGIGIWTELNDQNPGAAGTGPGGVGTGPEVKPCIEISCSDTDSVFVEAITECATVSNFRGRFSPENMNVLMTYLDQAFAAVSEREVLRQMRAHCLHETTAAVFGFSRDLLTVFDRIRAYYRSRYRLSDNVPLKVVLNADVRELIRIDLRRGAFPYSGSGGPSNSLVVSDAEIDALLASMGLSPTWVLDDDIGDQKFAAATAGTQGSPATFPSFPTGGTPGTTAKVRFMAYPEGSFQLLDGGSLDIGVVRDSVLNAQNKYQVFSETFEAVAFRGFEAIDFVIEGVPSGSTAGTVTPTGAGI